MCRLVLTGEVSSSVALHLYAIYRGRGFPLIRQAACFLTPLSSPLKLGVRGWPTGVLGSDLQPSYLRGKNFTS